MKVTTQIPSGNGRLLRADAGAIELELIAYSKGARYGYLRISGVSEAREQLLILRPDRHFALKSFAYKLHSRIWVRHSLQGRWEALPESMLERTPEAVRAWLPLRAGAICEVCTEIPHPYAEVATELAELVRTHHELAQLHSPGASEEGRPIFVVRVTAPENRCEPGEEARPVIHTVCGEHATEVAGEEIGRGMLALALAQSPEAEALRHAFIFDFILTANPDGNFHGWHQYNLRDWLAHNYTDGKDRSWHHEFAPCLLGEPGEYSAETVALIGWLRRTRPALYLSMHSWEGHDGHAGAFHTAPENLPPEGFAVVEALNAHAIAAAKELGETFLTRASRQSERHLGELLMERGICAAYLPEGHGNWGPERLQRFGANLLTRLLQDETLALSNYDPARWEALVHEHALA